MASGKYLIRQRDFSGGEVVEHAKRRDDEAVVRSACRSLRNVHILASGAVEQRAGRSALFQEDGCTAQVRVAAGIVYRLCFGDGTLTIRDDDGLVVARAWGYAWTAATANQIVWDLFNKDVVICFPGQVPKIARWDGATGWTFLDWAATVTAAGKRLTPFVRIAPAGVTMALSALTGDVTVTFVGGDVLNPGHVGTRFRYYDKQITITSVASPTSGTATINEVLREVFSVDYTASILDQFSVGDVVEGVDTGAKSYIAEVGTPGSDDATIIRLNAINGGASEVYVGPTGSATFSALNASPTTAPAITVWDEELFNEYRGWPQSVVVDQNRLIFCDFPGMPEAIVWSASGDHFDMASGSADDADPTDAIVEFVPKKARVYHIRDGADEFVFTDQGIYYVPISESNPLRPGSVSFRRIPGAAASKVEPVSTAQGVAYVSSGLNRVLAIVGTGQTAQPYIVRPASDLHSHLFSGVVCLEVYEGDGDPPDELVFAVNGDGTVIVGRFQAGKEWVGWLPWDGAGEVKWISALGASILFSVDYDAGGLVEELDEDRYLDAAVDYDAIPAPLAAGAQADLLLPDEQGTAIGDMTAGGGIAAAFDGVTAVTSVSLVTSATGTSSLGGLTMPSGIQAGDLLVLWQRATSGATPPTVVSAGFVSIVNFTATNTRAIASYKIALGNESGTNTSGMIGATVDSMLYVFRANLPLSVVTVGDVASSGGDTDPADQVVNVSGLSSPLLVFGCYASSGAIDPRSFSTTKDGEINSGTDAYLAYKIYNSAPADSTIGMDDEGNANCLASFYIQVAAPAASKTASTTGAVGKTFGQPLKIAKIEVWPPTGVGFTDQATVEIRAYAKQGDVFTNFAGGEGTIIATSGSIADTTSMVTLTSTDEATAWDHVILVLIISSGITYVSEVRFYSPGLTHDTGELWFLAGDTLKMMDGLRNVGDRLIDSDGEVVLQEGDVLTDQTFGHVFGDVVVEPFVPHVGPGQSAGQTVTNRQISQIAIAVQNSTGFKVQKWNPNESDWDDLQARGPYKIGTDNESLAPPLREEVWKPGNLGGEIDPRWRVVKDYPGPVRVLELSVEIGA